jgi:cupin 2 domain-containing protein
MNPVSTNIFKKIPEQLPEELIENIVQRDHIQIERIVSKGHTTASDQWYDQDRDEWVILLQGQAIILYEQDMQSVHLGAGDYLLIPAHTRHRVEWTQPNFNTIWLAAHFR